MQLDFSERELKGLTDDKFKQLIVKFVDVQQEDRKENQLLYYQPVSKHALEIHKSKATTVGVGGGNRSSKTETCLVHFIMCATGIIPDSLKDEIDVDYNFRGPINIRVVVESLTTTLHQVILSKLQWWKWTGIDREGGERGHYGWIPKTSLIDGRWDKSWSEKLRTLRVICRDPETGSVMGESTLQFMSHDQDPTDFASDQFHLILEDEPPKFAIWRENEARTMAVDGRHFLAMTWPDDPAIPVDWLFDEVYDRGVPGPSKHPDIDWFNLFTTDNPNLNQETIAKKSALMSDEVRKVRIFGQPIRFSNRIHPNFTDIDHTWCFTCGKDVLPIEGKCTQCEGTDFVNYNHVQDFEASISWPTVFILDPHPRKPHMFMWVQIDPSDDLWVIADGAVDGDCTDVKEYTDMLETSIGLRISQRLIDPNMGRSPASQRRGVLWVDEFESAGLRCDLADDSGVGRKRINQYLKPDKFREQPRMIFNRRVTDTIHQMKRYVWDSHRASLEKDLKQKPKTKYDDYPTMLKYLMNTDPSFSFLNQGAPILRTR